MRSVKSTVSTGIAMAIAAAMAVACIVCIASKANAENLDDIHLPSQWGIDKRCYVKPGYHNPLDNITCPVFYDLQRQREIQARREYIQCLGGALAPIFSDEESMEYLNMALQPNEPIPDVDAQGIFGFAMGFSNSQRNLSVFSNDGQPVIRGELFSNLYAPSRNLLWTTNSKLEWMRIAAKHFYPYERAMLVMLMDKGRIISCMKSPKEIRYVLHAMLLSPADIPGYLKSRAEFLARVAREEKMKILSMIKDMNQDERIEYGKTLSAQHRAWITQDSIANGLTGKVGFDYQEIRCGSTWASSTTMPCNFEKDSNGQYIFIRVTDWGVGCSISDVYSVAAGTYATNSFSIDSQSGGQTIIKATVKMSGFTFTGSWPPLGQQQVVFTLLNCNGYIGGTREVDDAMEWKFPTFSAASGGPWTCLNPGSVTVTGANFGSSAVSGDKIILGSATDSWCNMPTTTSTSYSSTSITVPICSGYGTNWDLSMLLASGSYKSALLTGSTGVSYNNAPSVTITDPQTVSVSGGGYLTIWGSNLAGSCSVYTTTLLGNSASGEVYPSGGHWGCDSNHNKVVNAWGAHSANTCSGSSKYAGGFKWPADSNGGLHNGNFYSFGPNEVCYVNPLKFGPLQK